MPVKRVKLIEDENESMSLTQLDRISALPDPILHQILSSLPSIVAVRMSILSKRWRHMWASTPALYFHDRKDFSIGKLKSKKFCNFVHKCLKHRSEMDFHLRTAVLNSFKLDMVYHTENICHIKNWLRYALHSNVKELDLRMRPNASWTQYYCLPQTLLHGQLLTVLKLNSLKLEGFKTTSLPCLETLHLKFVLLDDMTLHSLTANSPSMNYLFMEDCCGLSDPRISSPTLKSLRINYTSCNTIEVEGLNLSSFEYRGDGGKSSTCDINLDGCEALNYISLSYTKFKEEWLENLISKHPLLESLTLDCCFELRDINITSLNPGRFALRNYRSNDGVKITINTPNLVKFTYEGSILSNIVINAPNLMETNVKFYSSGTYDTDWYCSLLNFLGNINCSSSLCLDISSAEALIFPENLRSKYLPPLPSLKHLKIKTCSSMSNLISLRDSLVWFVPSCCTITIDSSLIL